MALSFRVDESLASGSGLSSFEYLPPIKIWTLIWASGALFGLHLYIPESPARAPCIKRWIVVLDAFSVITYWHYIYWQIYGYILVHICFIQITNKRIKRSTACFLLPKPHFWVLWMKFLLRYVTTRPYLVVSPCTKPHSLDSPCFLYPQTCPVLQSHM